MKEPILIISELVSEATLHVDKDKIELVAMDPANIAMVIFKLLSSAFVEYEVKEKVDLTVNLDNFKQILRRANPNDSMTLELSGNKLKIQLKSSSTRTFSLSLINAEESNKKIPNLSFPTKIETTTSLFNEAIEDSETVSDSVSFIVDEDIFSLEASGNLTSSKVDLEKGESTKIESEGKVEARYSTEYLKKMIKVSKLTDNVSIQFNQDYPLKLSYKILDKMLMEFILAPRVSTD